MTRFIVRFITLATLGLGSAHAELPPRVSDVLRQFDLPEDSVSVLVQRLDQPAPPSVAHLIDTPRVPASVMKIVTSLAGFDLLGLDYRWRTRFSTPGHIEGDTLVGDLILTGGGDPLLVIEDFWRMVHGLYDRGIRRITGDFVVDNTLFETAHETKETFDQNTFRPYNARPDAAMINFHATRFVMSPMGSEVRLFADPGAVNLRIDNRIQAIDGPCGGAHRHIQLEVTRDAQGTIARLDGRLPKKCGERSLTRSVIHGPDYAFGVFLTLWRELGGRLDGGLRVEKAPGSATLLLDHESRPFAEVVKGLNKFSNNVMARQLLLTLGAAPGGPPASIDTGRAAIQRWLESIGMETTGFKIDNGAGLSRTAQITARQLGDLLRYAYEQPYMPEFLSTLPLAAIDGSLKKRFVGGPARGRLRLKTGFLNGVRSLAGYLDRGAEKRFMVVVLQNHATMPWSAGAEVQDAVVNWLFDTL